MLICGGTEESLADAVKLSFPAVSFSGSGVANVELLHPFDPVGQQTTMLVQYSQNS